MRASLRRAPSRAVPGCSAAASGAHPAARERGRHSKDRSTERGELRYMVEQGNGKTFSAFSSLRRFAQESEKAAEVTQEQATQERCELCSEPIPPVHHPLR